MRLIHQCSQRGHAPADSGSGRHRVLAEMDREVAYTSGPCEGGYRGARDSWYQIRTDEFLQEVNAAWREYRNQ